MSNMIQMILLTAGILAFLAILIFAFAGPSVDKAAGRRLNTLKARHSDNPKNTVEAQMKKAKSRFDDLKGKFGKVA